MAEAQLTELAQPTRYHELDGETVDPWCHIYMQKNWIHQETSGFFQVLSERPIWMPHWNVQLSKKPG